MRAFISRTGGDVQGWYKANKAKLSPAAVAQIEPYLATLPKNLDSDEEPQGAKLQVGAFVALEDRPSASQGCYTGKAGDEAFGAHTYWTGADEGEDRAFDQAFLDRLALNCTAYPMMAAFCAWDGGRLQTYEENDAAYGPGLYPWGNTPEAAGFQNYPNPDSEFIKVGPGAITPGHAYGPCPECEEGRMNWSNSYQHPAEGVAAKPWDFAYFISPPGRFPLDKAPNGPMDMGGLMLEITASPGVTFSPGEPAVDPKYGAKVRWGRAGSWEGHQANNKKWQFAILTKYGKTGARCARD